MCFVVKQVTSSYSCQMNEVQEVEYFSVNLEILKVQVPEQMCLASSAGTQVMQLLPSGH